MRSVTENLRRRHAPRRDARGFTLVELLISLTVLIVVIGTVSVMLYLSSKSKTATAERMESGQGARAALERMAGDLRSAGYGADLDYTTPQPQIAYIDSMQVLITANRDPYPDTMTIAFGVPRAYKPTASPRPFPLNGTAWQPPIKYRTGAELIRYSLDANNDGAVDGNDMTGNGWVAGRTQNPNDYVLIRQVYGDSSKTCPTCPPVADYNGGDPEQIALVRKPGSGVPPIFTVYLKGSTVPWDWSNGPVPTSQLNNIERIALAVDAPSATKDSKGNYAETVLRTEVNSMRNIPNFGGTQYAISGYVYNDANTSNAFDTGDVGLANVLVRLGSYTAYTNSSGYFLFRVYAGTYTLRHTAPPGYACYTVPDSFVLNVTSAMTRSFADRRIPGGDAILNVFEDLNDNHAYDAGEPGVPSIPATLTPGPVTNTTDANGNIRLFSPPGAFTVTLALPDSYTVNTTPYPWTGTMINGDSASARIGLKKSLTGTVAGKVFNDSNRDGVWQSGEAGIQGVWVGCTNNGGSNILGYGTSNASGDYSFTVPINDPPHTTPYSLFCIPPAGKFPTSSTSIANLWVQTASNLTGNNFGMAAYTVITLNASRVLSLAAGDMIEKDWNGNQTQNAVGDQDLILGADAGATDNISVWFNQYNSTPLFNANSDYTRLAPQSVLALSADTLDSDATWKARRDIVTGTKNNVTSGNFFVWLNQNTSGNYGILPTTYSAGLNYRTNDAGDVQALLTFDCAGGAMPDIIVGTKGTTANTGTIEVWQNSDAVSPTFSRQEIYPNAGSIPGNKMGEVNSMILADLNGDGRKDLIVGTKTSTSGGEIMVFENVSKTNGNRFVNRAVLSCPNDIITALGALDVDGNSRVDIVAGTQFGTNAGNLMTWSNVSTTGTNWTFLNTRTQAADGIVQTLVVTDLGGTTRNDIAVGWRSSTASYNGGIRIYYTDVFGIPSVGTDPSAGSIVNFVPAVCTGNFNYGVNPAPAGPYLTDLATGVKISATTGALVVFIR